MNIKGLPLYILKHLSDPQTSQRNSFGPMHQNIGCKSRAEFNEAIKNLSDNHLIEVNQGEVFDTYSLTNQGKEFIEEYNDYALTDVFNGNYDFAILKFLYHMDSPVRLDFFPNSILIHTPKVGKGMGDSFHLGSYIDFESSLNRYVEGIGNNEYRINSYGIKYYDHLMAEGLKDTQINRRPLVHIEHFGDKIDNSSNAGRDIISDESHNKLDQSTKIHDSSFLDSDENQTVTITPNINGSNAIKRLWYKSIVATYFIFPLIFLLMVWFIAYLVTGHWVFF